MFKQLLIISLALALAALLLILLVTQSAFLHSFNLSSSATSNIGSTIGGITSPLLNIASIYFLYLAFTKQQDANQLQSKRNDIDLAFRILDDVKSELNSFTIKEYNSTTKQENVYVGTIGLFRYCKPFLDNPGRYELFKQQYESDIIISILFSYDLMVEKFAAADLTTDIPKQFFLAKLKVPLSYLVTAQILETDDMAITIRKFYNKYVDEPITVSDLDPTDKLWQSE